MLNVITTSDIQNRFPHLACIVFTPLIVNFVYLNKFAISTSSIFPCAFLLLLLLTFLSISRLHVHGTQHVTTEASIDHVVHVTKGL